MDVTLFEIDEASSIPIWVQLKNRFEYLVASGYYKPGDKLPTVRGLAVDLSINYNTVSKVYKSLEAAGYVETNRQGAFALDISDKPGVNAGAAAEIVTQEYFKRCTELGMTLEEIQRQFESAMREARGKRG